MTEDSHRRFVFDNGWFMPRHADLTASVCGERAADARGKRQCASFRRVTEKNSKRGTRPIDGVGDRQNAALVRCVVDVTYKAVPTGGFCRPCARSRPARSLLARRRHLTQRLEYAVQPTLSSTEEGDATPVPVLLEPELAVPTRCRRSQYCGGRVRLGCPAAEPGTRRPQPPTTPSMHVQ